LALLCPRVVAMARSNFLNTSAHFFFGGGGEWCVSLFAPANMAYYPKGAGGYGGGYGAGGAGGPGGYGGGGYGGGGYSYAAPPAYVAPLPDVYGHGRGPPLPEAQAAQALRIVNDYSTGAHAVEEALARAFGALGPYALGLAASRLLQALHRKVAAAQVGAADHAASATACGALLARVFADPALDRKL
jgi:hypothetical protein